MERNEKKFNLSFEKMIHSIIIKHRRLFPAKPIYYRGAEVVNVRTNERGTVSSFTCGAVNVLDKDGNMRQVRDEDLMPAETYDSIMENLVMASIFYKGKETPAVLISEGTFVLPCPRIFEEYASKMLVIPDRNRLKGRSWEAYPDQLRKFLSYISWDDRPPEEYLEMSEEKLDEVISEENAQGEPKFTIENVRKRMLDLWEIKPCENCTVPLTCDCRMRIVQQVKGRKARSYKTAQYAIRDVAEPMSFLLKGRFRGNPLVRWKDYDVFLDERLDKHFDLKWVKIIGDAIQTYEKWSGKSIGSNIREKLDNAAQRFRFSCFEELESSLKEE